jgi:hypothetical protein
MCLLRDTTEAANERDSDHAEAPGMQNVMVPPGTALYCHVIFSPGINYSKHPSFPASQREPIGSAREKGAKGGNAAKLELNLNLSRYINRLGSCNATAVALM